jgi:NADH-quinone oxidoreductase subunit M
MYSFLQSVNYDAWILTALLVLPVLGALAIWLQGATAAGRSDDAGERTGGFARHVALIVLVAEFILSLGLWWTFNPAESGWQAAVDVPWIDAWGVRYTLGVDGISLMMVLRTTFLMPVSILGGWTSVRSKVHSYHALMLLLTTGMLGVFVARDLFLFYVIW